MTDDIQIIREALAAGRDFAVAERARVEEGLRGHLKHKHDAAEDDVIRADAALPALGRLIARLEAAETALALWEHAYESGCVDADLAAAYKATP